MHPSTEKCLWMEGPGQRPSGRHQMHLSALAQIPFLSQGDALSFQHGYDPRTKTRYSQRTMHLPRGLSSSLLLNL